MSQYRCSRHDWYICLSPSPSSPFHSLCWSSVGKELSKERQRCVTMEGREREEKKQLKDKSRGSRWNSGASDLAPGMLYRRRRRRLGWIYRERSRQIGWRTLLSVAGSLTAGRPAQPSISFSLSLSRLAFVFSFCFLFKQLIKSRPLQGLPLCQPDAGQ